MALFFIVGTVNSWDFKHYFVITDFCPLYMLIRFLIVLLIGLIMKIMGKKIVFKRIIEKILITLNIIINIITFIPAIHQGLSSA
jgi:hypothetical protein